MQASVFHMAFIVGWSKSILRAARQVSHYFKGESLDEILEVAFRHGRPLQVLLP